MEGSAFRRNAGASNESARRLGENLVAMGLLNYIRDKNQTDAASLESRNALSERIERLPSGMPDRDREPVAVRVARGKLKLSENCFAVR